MFQIALHPFSISLNSMMSWWFWTCDIVGTGQYSSFPLCISAETPFFHKAILSQCAYSTSTLHIFSWYLSFTLLCFQEAECYRPDLRCDSWDGPRKGRQVDQNERCDGAVPVQGLQAWPDWWVHRRVRRAERMAGQYCQNPPHFHLNCKGTWLKISCQVGVWGMSVEAFLWVNSSTFFTCLWFGNSCLNW